VGCEHEGDWQQTGLTNYWVNLQSIFGGGEAAQSDTTHACCNMADNINQYISQTHSSGCMEKSF